ncbi:13664_t:CDS:2, partial [Funneliformis mosseae]
QLYDGIGSDHQRRDSNVSNINAMRHSTPSSETESDNEDESTLTFFPFTFSQRLLSMSIPKHPILNELMGSDYQDDQLTLLAYRIVLAEFLILKDKKCNQETYNYMGESELRYGILATYDHWFLRREHTKLWISKALPLYSESPPVLNTYAYLARKVKENPQYLQPIRIPVPTNGNINNPRILQSHLSSSQSVL